jgi:hypothetical protein
MPFYLRYASGHDFSRAANISINMRASAPEGCYFGIRQYADDAVPAKTSARESVLTVVFPSMEKLMKRLLAIFLCILFPAVAIAGDNGYKVVYDGGSVPGIKAGTDIKLYIEGDKIRIVKSKEDLIIIPASAITEISYGQDVHRRVGAAIGVGVFTLGIGALMALSKSKKHFVGLTWDDGGKKGGFAFQADKNDYRGLVAGLEGITGKKAVDSTTMNVKN